MPPRLKWTRVQYERAIEAGLFDHGSNVELIGGDITEKMSPQNSPHSAAIGALQFALGGVFEDGYWIRIQLPLALGEDSEPEPDVAVVTGSWRDYTAAQPSSALLVVEVSDNTLVFDCGAKASLYARAGIPEYWILNLQDRVLEVFRDPAVDVDQPFGYIYKSATRYTVGQNLSPLAANESSVSVSDLLP